MSRRAIAIWGVCLGLAIALSLSSSTLGLIDVEVSRQAGGIVIDLRGESGFEFSSLSLSEPDRFVLDLQGVENRTGIWKLAVGSPQVEGIRIGQFRSEPAPVVRVVFDLTGPSTPMVERLNDGIRLRFGTSPASLQSQVVEPAALSLGQGRGSSFSLPSPFDSIQRSRRMLDNIATRIMLELDYEEGQASGFDWRLASTNGLEDRRFFYRREAGDRYSTIEIAVGPHPTNQYEIHVYSQVVAGGQRKPNPDLESVRAMFAETSSIPLEGQGRELGELDLQVIQLSFTQIDRALGLLKALGYSVIEFTKEEGDSVYDVIYKPQLEESWKPPLIIKLTDSPKTSLMDEFVHPDQKKRTTSSSSSSKKKDSAVPDIGGTYLHNVTSGEPQQRLLVVYEKSDPESAEFLLNLIREKIDVPAQQVVIEALVIEIDSNTLRDVGVTFQAAKDKSSANFSLNDDGSVGPFTYMFDKYSPISIPSFKATLSALVSSGEAELLSSPSVLVLDGRQARIQIGQQVPVVSSTATVGVVSQKVEYFPVGIVLNLRPRIANELQEVTMQVETIVSAVSSTATAAGDDVFQAPTVDNRKVQTFVRVADNTPFIIGGLINTLTKKDEDGIPGLSKIPLLGALFRRRVNDVDKREVIVVLTPHIVPLEAKNFSYVIPKETDFFDTSFGHNLFRNAYRLQSKDIFDLSFVQDSEVLDSIVDQVRERAAQQPNVAETEPFRSIMKGAIPGEDILVRRMLYETVESTGFSRLIGNQNMIFFVDRPDGQGIEVRFLHQVIKEIPKGMNVVELAFEANPEATPEKPFVAPTAVIKYHDMTAEALEAYHVEANARGADGRPKQWSILIGNDHNFLEGIHPGERLKRVLVMKKILKLNTTLDLTLKDFYVGRQIIYPSEDDISQRNHVIDADTAKMFFEVEKFYLAFEQEFNLRTRELLTELQRVEAGIDPDSQLDGSERTPPKPAFDGQDQLDQKKTLIKEARRLLDSDSEQDRLAAYRIALDLADQDPAWTEAQRLAAEASFHQEDWYRTLSYFRSAGLDPARPEHDAYLAVALYETGEHQAAARTLERRLPELGDSKTVLAWQERILGPVAPMEPAIVEVP